MLLLQNTTPLPAAPQGRLPEGLPFNPFHALDTQPVSVETVQPFSIHQWEFETPRVRSPPEQTPRERAFNEARRNAERALKKKRREAVTRAKGRRRVARV